MSSNENDISSEYTHWLVRARYHFRMEEYWRDRALSAELALENLLRSKKTSTRKSRTKSKKIDI